MKIQAGPIFNKNYTATEQIIINRGGTSSTKTGSILRLCLLWLVTGQIDSSGKVFKSGILSIVRKFSATLTRSVQRDFDKIIYEQEEIRDHIQINKSEKTYKYGDRVIEFIGIDDPQKARGPRRDILYCNEANELSQEDFFQLHIRTSYKTFIDFNPDDEDIWINTELEQKRALQEKDVKVIVSTYKDNPFLDAKIVKEIERLGRENEHYWQIYGLGQYGRLEGLVFKNITTIAKVPDEAKLLGHGQDFGFTNDPSAMVSLYYWNGAIILDERIYETGLNNNDLANKYKEIGINKYDDIVADSSEPKSIDEIQKHGYRMKGVTKGNDSIRFGLTTMNGYKIYVTENSTNLRKELRKYMWKKDKNGNCLNEPIDSDNHAIDASRYICMDKLKLQTNEFDITIG